MEGGGGVCAVVWVRMGHLSHCQQYSSILPVASIPLPELTGSTRKKGRGKM